MPSSVDDEVTRDYMPIPAWLLEPNPLRTPLGNRFDEELSFLSVRGNSDGSYLIRAQSNAIFNAGIRQRH